MRLLVLLVLLLLQTVVLSTAVAAQDPDDATTLYEQEMTERDTRRLVEEAPPEPREPPTPSEPETAPAPAPASAPTPELTPDPNIPPGMEDMELVAFRLEYAEEHALISLMEWAYDWVAMDRRHDDGLLRARDLPDFLHRTLNPAEEDIEDDERTLLQEAADTLRAEQGLLDDDMRVYIGFLSRGSPARYVRQLAHEMHHQNRARRLQDFDRDL